MKLAGAHLLFFVVAGALAAQPVEPAPPAGTSVRLKQEIRATLPKFVTPPAAQPEPTAGTEPAGPPDPDVLVLPTLTIQEKRLPSDAADHLMSPRDFNRKMENLYLDTIAEDGPLNVLLNSIALPVLNQVSISIPPRFSKAAGTRAIYRAVEIARGRAIYRAREVERLQHVGDIRHDHDPAAEKEFKREIDNTHTTRPAGN